MEAKQGYKGSGFEQVERLVALYNLCRATTTLEELSALRGKIRGTVNKMDRESVRWMISAFEAQEHRITHPPLSEEEMKKREKKWKSTT